MNKFVYIALFLFAAGGIARADDLDLMRRAACDCFAYDFHPDRGPAYRAEVEDAYRTFASLPDSVYLDPKRVFYLPAYLECAHKWLLTAAPHETTLTFGPWSHLARLSLLYYEYRRAAAPRPSGFFFGTRWFVNSITPNDGLAQAVLDGIIAGHPLPEAAADSAMELLGRDLGQGVTYFLPHDGWQDYLSGSRARYEPFLLYRTLILLSGLRAGEAGPALIVGMHEPDFGSLSRMFERSPGNWPEEYGP